MDIFETIRSLKGADRRKFVKEVIHYARSFPSHLVRITDFDISMPKGDPLIEAWRSSRYMVQVYQVTENIERLSICHLDFNDDFTRWKDGISWDKIQRLKRECGRGDFEACEMYPIDSDIVDVANMRHLWIMRTGSFKQIGIGWKRNVD